MISETAYPKVHHLSKLRLLKDKMAGSAMFTFTMVSVLLLVLIGLKILLEHLDLI